MKLERTALALALALTSAAWVCAADAPLVPKGSNETPANAPASQTNPAVNPDVTTDGVPARMEMPGDSRSSVAPVNTNVQGTIESIDRRANRITVKDAAGNVVQYSLNGQTAFTRNERKAALKDVKVGDAVMYDYSNANGVSTIDKINIQQQTR